MQTRAVEFAKKYNVPLHVRNSQNDHPGTWIVAETANMEHIVVSGAALKKDLTRVTIKNVPDRPGIAARLFRALADANVNIATFNLGRVSAGDDAIALVGVDQQPTDALLGKIQVLPHVKEARVLRF